MVHPTDATALALLHCPFSNRQHRKASSRCKTIQLLKDWDPVPMLLDMSAAARCLE